MALITKSPPEPVSQDQYLRVNVSELLQGQYLRISISEPAHQSLSNDVVLFIALMLGAGAISVVANVVVILTMVLTRKLRCKSSSAFVVSLSFADLGLTGVTVPLAVCSAVNGQWIFSQITCELTSAVSSLFLAGSALSVAAVAVDRYLAIIYCLQYTTWPKWRYIAVVLSVVWVQAVLLAVVPAFRLIPVAYDLAQQPCNNISDSTGLIVYLWIKTCFAFIIPLLILVVVYSKIIRVTHMHSKRIVVAPPQSSERCEQGRRVEISTKGAVAAGIMFSVKKLSIVSMPHQDEGSTPKFYFQGDWELIGNASPTPGVGVDYSASELDQGHPNCVSTALRLASLVLMFSLGHGLYSCVRLYGTLYSIYNHDSRSDWYSNGEDAIKGGDLMKANYTNSSEHIDEHFSVFDTDHLIKFSLWVLIVNSMLNPFLYAVLSQRFRYFAWRLFYPFNSGRMAGTDQKGDNLFDISLYTAYLRNLQGATHNRSTSECSFQSSEFELKDSGNEASRTIRESQSVTFTPVSRSTTSTSQLLEVPTPFSVSRESEFSPSGETVEPKSPKREQFNNASRVRQASQRRSRCMSGSPSDDYVFSQNNTARIRIQFDMV